MEHVFQAPHNEKRNRKWGQKIEDEHAAATSARRPVPLCHFIPSHPRKFCERPIPMWGTLPDRFRLQDWPMKPFPKVTRP
jgi:hypothetical protein